MVPERRASATTGRAIFPQTTRPRPARWSLVLVNPPQPLYSEGRETLEQPPPRAFGPPFGCPVRGPWGRRVLSLALCLALIACGDDGPGAADALDTDVSSDVAPDTFAGADTATDDVVDTALADSSEHSRCNATAAAVRTHGRASGVSLSAPSRARADAAQTASSDVRRARTHDVSSVNSWARPAAAEPPVLSKSRRSLSDRNLGGLRSGDQRS